MNSLVRCSICHREEYVDFARFGDALAQMVDGAAADYAVREGSYPDEIVWVQDRYGMTLTLTLENGAIHVGRGVDKLSALADLHRE